MRTSCTRHPPRGLLRAGWLAAVILAAGACGGEDAVPAVDPTASPLVVCLDACTLSCMNEEGIVDQECAVPCAYACLCEDACRQECRGEDGVVDEACARACIAEDCVISGAGSRSSWSPDPRAG